MKLSELMAEIIKSNSHNQSTAAAAAFGSDDRKHLDWLHRQLKAKGQIKKFDTFLEHFTKNVTAEEVVEAIELIKQKKNV